MPAGRRPVPAACRHRCASAPVSRHRASALHVALRLQMTFDASGRQRQQEIIARWPSGRLRLASKRRGMQRAQFALQRRGAHAAGLQRFFQRGRTLMPRDCAYDAAAWTRRAGCALVRMMPPVPPFRANASINCRPVMSGRSRSSTTTSQRCWRISSSAILPLRARDDVRAGGLAQHVSQAHAVRVVFVDDENGIDHGLLARQEFYASGAFFHRVLRAESAWSYALA